MYPLLPKDDQLFPIQRKTVTGIELINLIWLAPFFNEVTILIRQIESIFNRLRSVPKRQAVPFEVRMTWKE